MAERAPFPTEPDTRLELARVVHDIANLIMTIEGHAVALRESRDPVESARVAEGILEATRRGRDLCRRILGNGDRCRTETADACEIAARVARMHEIALPDGLRLELALAGAPLEVSLDPAELARAVDNLIVNAIDALRPGGGRIRLIVRPECEGVRAGAARGVVLVVEDDGPGMSDEVLARAFEPGFTTRRTGSGLGLATVRSLVEDAGGRIALESAPGAGTRCVLELPGRHAPERAGERAQRVLVVEPDGSVRRLIERVLRSSGYESIVVADTPAALRITRSAEPAPEAVVVDIDGLTGSTPSVDDALRHGFPGARLVLLQNGRPLGADLPASAVVLAKPFRACDLLRALRGAEPLGVSRRF